MTIPPAEPLPPAGFDLPPARHRRALREEKTRVISDAERDQAVIDLKRKATASFEFFLFTFFCGLALSAAILFNSPALFILAALLAPFMAPVIGLGLSAVIGSIRFFLQSLAGFLLGCVIIFGLGAFSGWLSRLIHFTNFSQSFFHSRLTIPDAILLVIGVILTVILFTRPRNQRPLVTSVAIAYELYLPVGVAGFGLTSGIAGLWPDGLIVFGIHLAATVFLVMIVLLFKKIRFRSIFGYIILSLLILAGILFGLQLTGVFAMDELPRLEPVRTVDNPVIVPIATATWTPVYTPQIVKSESPGTPTNTLVPTATMTTTLTPLATLVQAWIHVEDSTGAHVRTQPDFNSPFLTSLLNGYLVYVYPGSVDNGGSTWVHIKLTDGREGWIVRNLLLTATPAPTW